MTAEKKSTATKKDIEAAQVAQALPKDVKQPLRKYGQSEDHTVAGIDYTFQFPGVRHAQRIIDAAKIGPNTYSDEAYNSAIMSDVIVKPANIDWDYWEEHDGYREVMALADNFLGRLLG